MSVMWETRGGGKAGYVCNLIVLFSSSVPSSFFSDIYLLTTSY